GAPGDIRDDRPRRKGRSYNGVLLRRTPRPSSFAAGNNLHVGHLDVSCIGASIIVCTAATSDRSSQSGARRPSPVGYAAPSAAAPNAPSRTLAATTPAATSPAQSTAVPTARRASQTPATAPPTRH